MRREIGRFKVVDQRNIAHTMIECVDVLSTGGLLDTAGQAPGMLSYRLADGTKINGMEDGTFEEVAGRRKFRRI